MPLRSAEGAPCGFFWSSARALVSRSASHWRQGIVQIAPDEDFPRAAGGQMTRLLRCSAGQFLSPGPGAFSSTRPSQESGGAGSLLHLSSPRFAVVVPAE